MPEIGRRTFMPDTASKKRSWRLNVLTECGAIFHPNSRNSFETGQSAIKQSFFLIGQESRVVSYREG